MVFERNLELRNNKFNFFDVKQNFRELSGNSILDLFRYDVCCFIFYSARDIPHEGTYMVCNPIELYAWKIDSIKCYLSSISDSLRASSRQNMNDRNIIAENFFRDILNVTCNYKLVSANYIEHNNDTFDLVDKKEKIIVQVTSNPSIQKIKSTVQKFNEKNLHKEYKKLIMYITTVKDRYKRETIDEFGKYHLDVKKDVWDRTKVVGECLNDYRILNKVFDFVTMRSGHVVDESIKSNIEGLFFMAVNYIHENRIKEDEDYVKFILAPNPEKKIRERFKQSAEFIIKQYLELDRIYGEVLKKFNAKSSIKASAKEIARWWQIKSYNALQRCDYNTEKAFSELTEMFKLEAKQNYPSLAFDAASIFYFCLHHLIKCNVFTEELIKNE